MQWTAIAPAREAGKINSSYGIAGRDGRVPWRWGLEINPHYDAMIGCTTIVPSISARETPAPRAAIHGRCCHCSNVRHGSHSSSTLLVPSVRRIQRGIRRHQRQDSRAAASGVDSSWNTEGHGRSAQAIELFQAPRKISFTFRLRHESFLPDDVKLAELSNNSFEWKNAAF